MKPFDILPQSGFQYMLSFYFLSLSITLRLLDVSKNNFALLQICFKKGFLPSLRKHAKLYSLLTI